MTDQIDPVEMLARALYGSSGSFFPWDSLGPETHDRFRYHARALLAQITPALVADAVAREREACATLAERWIEGDCDCYRCQDAGHIAAAIRARGQA